MCPLNNYFLAFPTCCHLKVVFAPEISSAAKSLLKGRRGTENRLLDFIEKSRKWTFPVVGTKMRSLEARKARRGESSMCDSFIWLLDSNSDQQCQYGGNSATTKACACVIRVVAFSKALCLGCVPRLSPVWVETVVTSREKSSEVTGQGQPECNCVSAKSLTLCFRLLLTVSLLSNFLLNSYDVLAGLIRDSPWFPPLLQPLFLTSTRHRSFIRLQIPFTDAKYYRYLSKDQPSWIQTFIIVAILSHN